MPALGDGVPQDRRRAVIAFRKACEGGLPEACKGLRRLETLPAE